MKLPAIFIIPFALMSPFAEAQAPATGKPATRNQAYGLAVGQKLLIQLKSPAEDASNVDGIYQIGPKGDIKMPYLQDSVTAEGLTCGQLARRLEVACREAGIFTMPTINVTPGRSPRQVQFVTVGGAVNSGGRDIPMRKGMRLFGAIVLAGGIDGSTRFVRIIRDGKTTTYNLDRSNNPLLKAGDQIIVP